jgi:succinoglycan biosynthesis transport protein ExoP
LVNSAQILQGNAIKSLFDDVLRSTYDYIIVDLSPLAPVVDVRATTGLVDSYIFLIEWGQTKVDVVKQALKEADGIHDNLLGVVLNKVDMQVMARYEGYRSQYYRNKYFARYGYKD